MRLLSPRLSIPNANAAADTSELQAAARHFDLELNILRAASDIDIDNAYSKLVQLSARALVIEGDAFFAGQHREQLIALSARYKIPTIYPTPAFAAADGLMAYGPSIPDAFRIAGGYAGRILKGEKPADLPVQQAVKFDLAINTKTAKTLDINFPITLLGRADEVIE
jgi:putative tryptophan/tyrosine transport system substrate-binding protein